jgi:hypothetical protein
MRSRMMMIRARTPPPMYIESPLLSVVDAGRDPDVPGREAVHTFCGREDSNL